MKHFVPALFLILSQLNSCLAEECELSLTNTTPNSLSNVRKSANQCFQIYIFGEVADAGLYEKISDSKIGRVTLSEAIGEAGGVKTNADIHNVKIIRYGAEPLSVDLWSLVRSVSDIEIRPGDVIEISSLKRTSGFVNTESRKKNSPDICVIGRVRRPGPVAAPSKRSIRSLLRSAGGANVRTPEIFAASCAQGNLVINRVGGAEFANSGDVVVVKEKNSAFPSAFTFMSQSDVTKKNFQKLPPPKIFEKS